MAPPRQCAGSWSGGVWREAAARRLPPLGPCGCIRDPDRDRHRCGDDGPSERMVDGYRAAALHLLDHQLTPAAFRPELRRLWRRGGADRALAVRVAQEWGLAG